MLARIVKSKLALEGKTVKEFSEEIGENYKSVHDVIHMKWGFKQGKVGNRILEKLKDRLDIDLDSINA